MDNNIFHSILLEEHEILRSGFRITKFHVFRDFYYQLRVSDTTNQYIQEEYNKDEIFIFGYPVEIHIEKTKANYWFETIPDSVPILFSKSP